MSAPTLAALTVEGVMDLMRTVVAERGYGYVQRGACVYVNARTGEPVCLIGAMLLRLGVTAEEILNSRLNEDTDVVDLLGKLPQVCVAEPAGRVILEQAQLLQDREMAWGDVLGRIEVAYRDRFLRASDFMQDELRNALESALWP